jgi:hypothetical protein
MDDGTRGLEHLLLKTFHAFVKHVTKVKEKVDGSAGSTSPLRKKKKWDLWEECLDGETLRFWKRVLDEKYPDVNDRTDTNFKKALVWLIRHLTATLEHHNSADCIYWQLAHRRKKASESPRDYLVRFQELLKVAKLCEAKEQRPDDKKCLGWFYCSMPASYRKQFSLMSQKKLYEYDLDELCDWMMKLAKDDKFVAEKEKKKKEQEKAATAKRKAAEEDSDSEAESPKSRKSNKKDKKKNKKSRKDHQKDRVGPNDTCTCGQGPPHKFNRCFLNVNGTNFHPERVINQGSRGGGSRDYSHSNRDNGKDRGDYRRDDNRGRGRDNRRSHDAHYHEDRGRDRSRSRSRSPQRRDSSRGRHDGYFVNDRDDYRHEDRRDYRGSREDERRVETSIFGRNR